MAETYSLSISAVNGNNARYNPANITIGDSQGRPGGQQNGMMTGTQVLCKRPDGSQAWFTIDSVRSVPGGSLVLLAV